MGSESGSGRFLIRAVYVAPGWRKEPVDGTSSTSRFSDMYV